MRKTEPKRNRRLYQLAASILVSLWAVTPGWVHALPKGGDIVSGAGAISQTAQDMVIQQNSQQLITNWQGFSIGSAESVTFKQPSSSAVALNRVIGVDPSIILGKLSANGQVFLTNPSGVVFGKNAKVDVHGLLATTLNITNEDFLKGDYQFSEGAYRPLAAIINTGVINATRYVGLAAPVVINTGSIIVADLGSVVLASGTTATLDFNGDGLINFAVTDNRERRLIKGRIHNSGLIRANGGQVLLTAESAGYVIGSVVNHSGVIEAQTVQAKDGKIILSGGDQGNIQVSGTLDASNVLIKADAVTVGARKFLWTNDYDWVSRKGKAVASKLLSTNNGDIRIVANDLDLKGNLNSGTGDVTFTLANGGNLTLSPDVSKGADIGGNDLSHITAKNLVLQTYGNITVKGMDEQSTKGISGTVYLVSGRNVIFNVGASVFSALNVYASNNINVNQNITTTKGDFIAMADSENNGQGDFNVAPGVVITSARDIDVSASNINADNDASFNETRDLILNGNVASGRTSQPSVDNDPDPTLIKEAIEQGTLGTFLTEFFQNGGPSGC